MTITAKFDLKTIQMNAVNAFMNCKLDEVVYMKQPPGFETEKMLQLQKTLYELRQSSLLWQKELTSIFRNLNFREMLQESCVMLNSRIITFFYVDDIVLCY